MEDSFVDVGGLFGTKNGHMSVPQIHHGIIQSRITAMFFMTILSLVLSIGAAVFAGLAYFNRNFDEVTVGHLVVKPDGDHPEGILVQFEGSEKDYAGAAAGIAVSMPKASSTRSTHQAGLLVTGGQFGQRVLAPLSAGVSVQSPNPAGVAIDVENGINSRIVQNNGSSVV